MKKYLPSISLSSKTSKGFTLIELMVVISIIAILSIVGITIFTSVQKNARDARRKADIDSISKAWESHYSNTTPRYPTLQGGWFSGGVIPSDPLNTGTYVYSGTGTNIDTYSVCANLENTPPSSYCISNQQ